MRPAWLARLRTRSLRSAADRLRDRALKHVATARRLRDRAETKDAEADRLEKERPE